MLNNVPNNAQVNSHIVMNYSIPKATNMKPINLIVLISELLR